MNLSLSITFTESYRFGASLMAHSLWLIAKARDARDLGSIPGSGSSPIKKWQPNPIFLPGKIPWTKEPEGLQSMGLQRV